MKSFMYAIVLSVTMFASQQVKAQSFCTAFFQHDWYNSILWATCGGTVQMSTFGVGANCLSAVTVWPSPVWPSCAVRLRGWCNRDDVCILPASYPYGATADGSPGSYNSVWLVLSCPCDVYSGKFSQLQYERRQATPYNNCWCTTAYCQVPLWYSWWLCD